MPTLKTGLPGAIRNLAVPRLAIAAVCLLVAGYLLYNRGAAPTTGNWYFDLETGDVVAHDAGRAYPPITLPNGHQAVVLHRFACGDCDGNDVWDGYLYKVTVEWLEAQQAHSDTVAIAPERGELVARVPANGGAPQWFDQNSLQGVRIMDVHGRCPGKKRPVPCWPQ